MGCVEAQNYTSGNILSTFTGANAAADCDQECGICCVPQCDTSVGSIGGTVSPTGQFCYYQEKSSGPVNVNLIYWASGAPPGQYVVISRSTFCDDFSAGQASGCGVPDHPCDGFSINAYGGFQKFEAKLLICNGDGTWSDEGDTWFDSTKRAALTNCPNSVTDGGASYFWPPDTGCAWQPFNCGAPSWPTDFGPWYNYSMDVWYEYQYGFSADGSDCCDCNDPPNCAMCDASGNAVTENGYCATSLTFGTATSDSYNCTDDSFGPWAYPANPNYICQDTPKDNCLGLPGGLWITGQTCQTYDCSAHNNGGSGPSS